MREMVKTDIPWMPEISSDFSVGYVKQYFFVSKDLSNDGEPERVLKLARAGIVEKDVTTNEGQMAASYAGYNKVCVGDLLLNPMDLYSGANCNVSELNGVISPAYSNLRAKRAGTVVPKYYDYYFKSQYWLMAMFAHGKGVSFDNRWTLNNDALRSYEIPVAPYAMQQKIVDAIQDGEKKVDSLIANVQAQIEKLKAYKQSLITEVVTKGLDPNAPMKDSGVEWIGKIPAHWSILRFKNIADIKSNLVNPKDYMDYFQVSPENIEKGSGKLLTCITVREIGVESNNHLFHKGQIIYSKVRPLLNKVAIAPFDGLCSADMYPVEAKINKKFLVYSMLSNSFLNQVKLVTENRVKMPKINQEELSKIKVCCPEDSEQKRIADYLDTKCSQIDQLISLKESKIEKLQQYKRSLIYEYVTGKKEVV